MAVDGAFGQDVTCYRFLGRTAEGRAWLAELPVLVARYESRWRLEVAAQVLTRLWSRGPTPELAGQVDRLETHTAALSRTLLERWRRLGSPAGRRLATMAAELLTSLPRSATREVVLHGDYNPGNVLTGSAEHARVELDRAAVLARAAGV